MAITMKLKNSGLVPERVTVQIQRSGAGMRDHYLLNPEETIEFDIGEEHTFTINTDGQLSG